MSIFCYKPMGAPIGLPERLSRRRQALAEPLEAVAIRTRIPPKYLAAFEAGRFELLPAARPYRLAYLREYARALGLDPASCTDQFLREEGCAGVGLVHPHRGLTRSIFVSISMATRHLALICLALLFGGYLVWQVMGILSPPSLLIYTPLEGDVINRPTVLVQGETEPESHLTINGQTIMVGEDGRFETTLDSVAGLNTIIIVATKKHGKTTTITRHLVVRPRSAAALDR